MWLSSDPTGMVFGLSSEVELRAEDVPVLPRVEVVRRLRDRLEPILVFGETEEESCRRLRQLELDEPEKVEGIRNDFRLQWRSTTACFSLSPTPIDILFQRRHE